MLYYIHGRVRAIPTYRVYRLYDTKLSTNRDIPEIGTNLPDQPFLTSQVRFTVTQVLVGSQPEKVARGDDLRGNNFLQMHIKYMYTLNSLIISVLKWPS